MIIVLLRCMTLSAAVRTAAKKVIVSDCSAQPANHTSMVLSGTRAAYSPIRCLSATLRICQ